MLKDIKPKLQEDANMNREKNLKEGTYLKYHPKEAQMIITKFKQSPDVLSLMSVIRSNSESLLERFSPVQLRNIVMMCTLLFAFNGPRGESITKKQVEELLKAETKVYKPTETEEEAFFMVINIKDHKTAQKGAFPLITSREMVATLLAYYKHLLPKLCKTEPKPDHRVFCAQGHPNTPADWKGATRWARGILQSEGLTEEEALRFTQYCKRHADAQEMEESRDPVVQDHGHKVKELAVLKVYSTCIIALSLKGNAS